MAKRARETYSNFAFLPPTPARLGALSEGYFLLNDANTCLLKLRQLGEQLAQDASRFEGMAIYLSHLYQLQLLQEKQVIDHEIADLLHNLRKAGGDATHDPLRDDRDEALRLLQDAWRVAVWFHERYGDPSVVPGPFAAPEEPNRRAPCARRRRRTTK